MGDWPGNEVYERWRVADDSDRKAIEPQLLLAVRGHASRVAWRRYGLNSPDLIVGIMADVWGGLPTFRGESEFSTWVEAIIRHKCVDMIRDLKREREHIDPRGLCDEDGEEQFASPCAQSHDPVAGATVDRILRDLTPTERELLELVTAGYTDRQIAEIWQGHPDAVETSRRRLQRRLSKK